MAYDDRVSGTSSRRAYIDWARGIAVLLMIEAHTIDAWTRPLSRTTKPFAYAIILGGFAAPAFLWLAGVGVALSAAGTIRKTGDPSAAVAAVCRRGLELFILAFLFRVQSFVVTPGSHPVTLFRVDILNVMGPAIVLAGLVWGVSARPLLAAVLYAMLALAVAMATPMVRAWAGVDSLPIWVQWYLRPAGDNTTFTLLPWSGFVFAGAACGVPLATVRTAEAEQRVHHALLAAGAALVALGFATASMPSIYASSSFWTSSPTYFAIRIGILTLSLSALYEVTGIGEKRFGLTALARFGRSSLFVYWIHVELVYGYATWLLHLRLPLGGSVVACAGFVWLMYAAVLGRDRLAEGWRSRLSLYTKKNIAV